MYTQKTIYPVTHKFIVKESNTMPMKKVLYPVTHSFVVKQKQIPKDPMEEYMDNFTGLIYEYYNTLPWVSSMYYRRDTAMDFRIACSYINFTSYTEDYGGGWLETEQDQFGLRWQHVNREGENTVYGNGMSWSAIEAYERENGGGGGLVLSAAEPYAYGGWDSGGEFFYPHQPTNSIGANNRFLNLSAAASSSGANNTWEFGWLGGTMVGNCLHQSLRSKDMVMWIYEMGYGETTLDTSPGIPNNALFLPGQSGVRKIANSYKNAPWERYPDLHSF